MFNGAPFFVSDCQMTCGRKTVAHEYPNKKYVYIEDMGENLRTFEITAIVTGDDDYILKREALILALQRKGIGVFSHPLYGVVYVVVTQYSVVEDMKALGECVFNITFRESKENIFPIAGLETASGIAGIIAELMPYVQGEFITQFSLVFKKNTTDAVDKSDKLVATVQPTRALSSYQDAGNNFKIASDNLSDNKYALVQTPSNFQGAISELLDAYNNLGATDQDSYDMNNSIFGFGDDDVPISTITAERIERVDNRLIFNSLVNAILLANLYQNATLIEYLDELQLDKIANNLEEKYQYLMLNNNLDKDSLDRLEQLRTSMRKFFDNVRVNVSKINIVSTFSSPLTVLLHKYDQLYEDEDEIIALNNIYNVFDIFGNIKILTTE